MRIILLFLFAGSVLTSCDNPNGAHSTVDSVIKSADSAIRKTYDSAKVIADTMAKKADHAIDVSIDSAKTKLRRKKKQ